MNEFLAAERVIELPEEALPSPIQKGRVLFEVIHIYNPVLKPYPWRTYEIEVIDWDGDSCVYWASEGVGVDYLVEEMLDVELPGFYVLDVERVYWTKDYHGEITEDWRYGNLRRASEEEIERGALP